ncbi:hypothetical protein GOP47_0028024 [Adiantum capillus-veneris]|nr:hypothetical protein GOP47_0028024 [Adiantum capillus-veneris]
MSTEGLHKRPSHKAEDEEEDTTTKVSSTRSSFTRAKDVVPLAIAVLIPLILGIIDAILNNPNQDFYRNLKKPSWNPPGWLFGLAWSIIYPLMGFASWLLWKQGGFEKQKFTLGLYMLQLIINLLWPYFFFGLHSIKLALVDIVALDLLLVICIISFKSVNQLASTLFKPYLAWVSFATVLNYSILAMN